MRTARSSRHARPRRMSETKQRLRVAPASACDDAMVSEAFSLVQLAETSLARARILLERSSGSGPAQEPEACTPSDGGEEIPGSAFPRLADVLRPHVHTLFGLSNFPLDWEPLIRRRLMMRAYRVGWVGAGVLLRLLDEPDIPVSVEELAAAAGARSTQPRLISVYVFHLRKALVAHGLPPEAIMSVRKHYMLRADAVPQIVVMLGCA